MVCSLSKKARNRYDACQVSHNRRIGILGLGSTASLNLRVADKATYWTSSRKATARLKLMTIVEL